MSVLLSTFMGRLCASECVPLPSYILRNCIAGMMRPASIAIPLMQPGQQVVAGHERDSQRAVVPDPLAVDYGTKYSQAPTSLSGSKWNDTGRGVLISVG